MMSTATIAVRTIHCLLSSSSSIGVQCSYFPSVSFRRRPTSILSIMSKSTHSPSSSIATLTCSIVSHAAVRGLISLPLLSTWFPLIRHYSSLKSSVWTPPPRVGGFHAMLLEAQYRTYAMQEAHGDGHHWLVSFCISGLMFATEQELFDFYIKALAPFVGSEAEAKNKIYLVSGSSDVFGFGAEIDENTKNKLIETHRSQNLVVDAYEDIYFGDRNKDPNFQSAAQSCLLNQHRRVDNIFSYHHLSEQNSNWNSDHWLIIIEEPDGGFTEKLQIMDFCIKLLADILGSEKEAKEKIYIIWFKLPFGFAAKVDAESSKKLKDLPNVLKVLPDYSFDVKENCDTLLVSLPPPGLTFSYYRLSEEFDFEDGVTNMEDHVGLPCRRFDCKHWFITVEDPGGEFASMQQRIDSYIQTLATVVGSDEEAVKKIYRVECEGEIFGFGAEVDVETSYKLKGMPRVQGVLPDCIFNNSNRVQSTRFTPLNRNHRLDDVYSYHHLSDGNTEWSSDHWLVHVRQPDCEVGTERQTIEFCIRLLADVIGSEKDAKEKIYIVWCKTLFGFGAEMDEKTSNELKGLPDVVMVLPDYAFDIKNKDRGALAISSPSCLKPDYNYWLLNKITDSGDEAWE